MYDSALVFSFLEILLYQIAIVSKLNCNLFPVTNSVGTPNLIQEFIPLEERDQVSGPSGVSLGNWCKVTIGNPPIDSILLTEALLGVLKSTLTTPKQSISQRYLCHIILAIMTSQ